MNQNLILLLRGCWRAHEWQTSLTGPWFDAYFSLSFGCLLLMLWLFHGFTKMWHFCCGPQGEQLLLQPPINKLWTAKISYWLFFVSFLFLWRSLDWFFFFYCVLCTQLNVFSSLLNCQLSRSCDSAMFVVAITIVIWTEWTGEPS